MRKTDRPGEAERLMLRIRILLLGFILGLVVSGLTAFPLPQEVTMLARWMGAKDIALPSHYQGALGWIVKVRNALQATDARFPFLAYGTDWLAFGHLVIATAFIGPVKDPVRNKWVIDWAILACVLVLPLALICGPIRGIPFWWRLIDCSFGVVGIIPLLVCRSAIVKLEFLKETPNPV